ncbi:hypothetical protein Slin15195_G119690 [Septoria linicola]|uniref:Uncharacterized protein n=1 Tax=Septoria linicola TaxID=215465 RepID=A0A9Q9EQ15_9PEZI|nr:hypothetical protein Slin15195_G119690 [Septoria linicola]
MAPPDDNGKGKQKATDYDSEEGLVEESGRPLLFTRAHNRLIERENNLPRGALNQAYREAFGDQVPDVIHEFLEQRRREQELELFTRFNAGTGTTRTSPRRIPRAAPGGSPSRRRTSAERLAEANASSIRRTSTSPSRAQQEIRQPVNQVQRGGRPDSSRPRAHTTAIGESFRRATEQRLGVASSSSIFGTPRAASGGIVPSLSIYSSPEQRRAAAAALHRSNSRSPAKSAGSAGAKPTSQARPPPLSEDPLEDPDVSEEDDVEDLDVLTKDGRRARNTNARLYARHQAIVEEEEDSDDLSDDVEEDEVPVVRQYRRAKYGDSSPTPTFGASRSPSVWSYDSAYTYPDRERVQYARPFSQQTAYRREDDGYRPGPPARSQTKNVRTAGYDVNEENWPERPQEFKKSKFVEDFDAPRPVSARSPLFGNAPRTDTNSTKRNWFGGLFGSKAPASREPISTSNGRDGGLFGDRPATPAPISPPGGGVFDSTRKSGSSFGSNYGAGDGLGDLDDETIEAIRLARRAAAGRRADVSSGRRGKYGLSCFTSSSSSKKDKEKNKSSGSSRPVPSPDYAPRYASGRNNFGGHAQVNGVNRNIPKRSNAIRDPYRNAGAQGVAGVSGVHRVPRVETRRAGTGRPQYFAPNPELRQPNKNHRQVPTTGQWMSGKYGQSRRY